MMNPEMKRAGCVHAVHALLALGALPASLKKNRHLEIE